MNRFSGGGPTAPKPFSWSYSRLKNFESCGFRYEQIDVLKLFGQDESKEIIEGKKIHDAMARAITGVPLPREYAHFQPWVDRLTSRGNDMIYVEQKLAITENKAPSEFFGKGAWYRGVIDYLKLVVTRVGTIGLVIDYKTGKRKEDLVQLALNSALVFARYPQVVKVRTEYIWLAERFSSVESTTREDFAPADMPDLWRALEPRIEALRDAYENNTYVPVPNRLCREWCPVKSCEYFGKAYRG